MNRTSISDLKLKAKDQLLGNYGIATGSFALLFVLVYALLWILMSAMSFGTMRTASMTAQPQSFMSEVTMWMMSAVLGLFSSILSTGYLYILFRIANGEKPVISDLFFVFRNHPDKIIIISFIMIVIQSILLIPADIVRNNALSADASAFLSGKQFLIWIMLYIAGMLGALIVEIMLAMCYMIYIDDTEADVMSIMRNSIDMMKGNKFRYFYMLISFIGYYVLIIFSLGIAALWVMPYQTMTTVEFYRDLKNADRYGETV